MRPQGNSGRETDDLITTQEAAAQLHVVPGQLAVWSDRFGWPLSERGGGYRADEISVLADALESCVSISAAISRARRETSALGRAPAPADCCSAAAAD